jgi:hypothetical protein
MVCSVSHLDSIIMSYSYFSIPFYNEMIVSFVKATKDRNITCMTSINSFVLSFEVTMKNFTLCLGVLHVVWGAWCVDYP